MRRVVANLSLSLDGRVSGPGGPYDMGWIVPNAVTDGARDHMVAVTSAASTALLGRTNYEGFGGWWPSVADDESADPRDRAFSTWLNSVEKVVFTHRPTPAAHVPWEVRLTDADPAVEVRALRETEGADIVVLSSISVIQQLLAADLVDRLGVTLAPSVVGGGRAFFEDALPASDWSLAQATPTSSGALCLLYDRRR